MTTENKKAEALTAYNNWIIDFNDCDDLREAKKVEVALWSMQETIRQLLAPVEGETIASIALKLIEPREPVQGDALEALDGAINDVADGTAVGQLNKIIGYRLKPHLKTLRALTQNADSKQGVGIKGLHFAINRSIISAQDEYAKECGDEKLNYDTFQLSVIRHTIKKTLVYLRDRSYLNTPNTQAVDVEELKVAITNSMGLEYRVDVHSAEQAITVCDVVDFLAEQGHLKAKGALNERPVSTKLTEGVV